MCDRVIFMQTGRIFYQGGVDGVVPTLAKFDYVCPSNYNPSDYCMFIIQTESVAVLEAKGVYMDGPKQIADSSKDTNTNLDIPIVASFFKQLYYLTMREIVSTYRNKPALIGRFGITIVLNIIYGVTFLDSGRRDDSISSNFQSHFGAMTMVMISSMFGSSQPTLLEFPNERPLFMREYSTGTYSTIPYFISKSVMELPLSFLQALTQFLILYWMIGFQSNFILLVLAAWGIGSSAASSAVILGCLVTDPKQAVEMSPLLFVPQLLFSGFFIRLNLIPVWLRWAQYLCSLKYGLNISLILEFSPWKDNCQGGAKENCANMLQQNDVVVENWWIYVIILVVITVGFRLIGAFLLAKSSLRFY
jgi:ABC-type multidrug transport system permease subunit